ncbi:TVG1552703 [Thermoplasma volcanium GSS1]|uniref:TVG1552703 protein n=1 Tax=Thermoplasma volcanium (strain ATCC 51530 / DSM 4299 / JCM 9571 / NBRC 15438 / GSS1) TaxID=273116 RepID=Q978B6_THEVO|nr:DEAD/DEAH box helicase family protein [Thermoplasma volcanium]BAB60643.1 TVG1552703 [Thermoplasma volcanium GSS1]
MVNIKSFGTKDIPLKLAKKISEEVNTLWKSGDFMQKVSPVTQELLNFWNPEGIFAEEREFNFHEGQWQAILNTIYIHEILKLKSVGEIYMSIYPDLVQQMDLLDLKRDKYEHPKYCIKMATGTGKTWVLDALLIWQYLNSRHEESESGEYSRNFLLVAPGIIVYERLLDAFLGKRKEDGSRDFEQSDFRNFEKLFIPPAYKDELFGFIQGCVTQKEEIGKKVTGDGLIAITNWHLLVEEEESIDADSPLDSPDITVKELLPIAPGTSQGHSLEELDNQYLRGRELEFLASLPDLVVFNDEAHHLGEMKKSDEVVEKKWQEALDKISENKKHRFMQVDFSATPYIVTGSGQSRVQNHFPHIIVNFDLVDAIKKGLVKTVAIDKRKEFGSIPLEDLEFKAEREGRQVTSLSDGQKLMLRAGVKKLNILEEEFTKLDSAKYPKMLIVCEDTKVVPLVMGFLKQEGYSDDELMEIHSNKKGDVSEDEWKAIKQRLFDIDRHEKPKVIVSVLMLREGFDVNNICVIVPLRSASSYVLLEQLIGRGLRLMWRGPEYDDTRKENREKLLVKKEEPNSYIDILSVVEHPNFIEYYERVLAGMVGVVTQEPDKNRIVGDLVKVGLKPNYKDYDLFWIIILQEKEEELLTPELSVEKLEPFPIKLEALKPLVRNKGDTFYSEELTVKTTFGEYTVTADIFTAKSYNSFIQKIVNAVSVIHVNARGRKQREFPVMQVNSALIAKLCDEYIRHRLFEEEFDPLKDNNWRILLITQHSIIKHVVSNIAKAVYDSMNNLKINDAKIVKRYFSEVKEIRIRETYAITAAKNIYEKIAYPSHSGGFEKDFIEFIDADSKVKAFVKINEYYNDFANIIYIRDDGLLAHYYPDFMIKACDQLYLVETKSERDMSNQNVKNKRLAAIDWIDKVNELLPEERMSCTWSYVLLSQNTFEQMKKQGATTCEILEYAKLTKAKVRGTLGDYMGFKDY